MIYFSIAKLLYANRYLFLSSAPGQIFPKNFRIRTHDLTIIGGKDATIHLHLQQHLSCFYLGIFRSGDLVVIVKQMPIVKKELQRLLGDRPVRHEAYDAHPRRDEEVVDLTFVTVVG